MGLSNHLAKFTFMPPSPASTRAHPLSARSDAFARHVPLRARGVGVAPQAEIIGSTLRQSPLDLVGLGGSCQGGGGGVRVSNLPGVFFIGRSLDFVFFVWVLRSSPSTY